MDISAIINEHGPAALGALAALIAAAWAILKFVAPLTKGKADDAFVEKHDETIEEVLDNLKDRP